MGGSLALAFLGVVTSGVVDGDLPLSPRCRADIDNTQACEVASDRSGLGYLFLLPAAVSLLLFFGFVSRARRQRSWSTIDTLLPAMGTGVLAALYARWTLVDGPSALFLGMWAAILIALVLTPFRIRGNRKARERVANEMLEVEPDRPIDAMDRRSTRLLRDIFRCSPSFARTRDPREHAGPVLERLGPHLASCVADGNLREVERLLAVVEGVYGSRRVDAEVCDLVTTSLLMNISPEEETLVSLLGPRTAGWWRGAHAYLSGSAASIEAIP